MTVRREWLRQFATAVRLVSLENFEDRNTCIFTTRLGVAVLTQAGIRARPQEVFVTAANMVAFRLSAAGVPVEQWPDDAWSVGIHGRGVSGGSGWDGHLVLVVREPGEPRLLIDLTADQFDRPDRGLVIGGPVFMDIREQWTPQDPLTVPIGDPGEPHTLVTYRPMPPGHTVTKKWRETPDGVIDQGLVDETAGRILERLGRPPGA